MTTTSAPHGLATLGDDLERAADRTLRAASGRRLRRALLAVAVVTMLGAGTAVAAGVFTPKQVAAGMPEGAMIFGNTHPACTLDGDGRTYHCSLESPPSERIDYRGSKQLLGIDHRIAGGCVGQDAAGLAWECYVGDDAVKYLILAKDLLGQPLLEPSKG
jgi:hypothetical protein